MGCNLKGKYPDEIKQILKGMGYPGFRGDQVYSWIMKGAQTFEEMTDLPLSLRKELAKTTELPNLKEVAKMVSRDGTQKYLFELPDGNVIETVLMRYAYGCSACLSTQVGCRMGCSFCASTIGGVVRNLEAWEFVDQVVCIQKQLRQDERIGWIVLMGSGEPLENFYNVIKALRLINHGLGISFRRMTLSTCGIVPKIIQLADTDIPITLSVSLHAPNDALRDRLMPINRIYPIKPLINACDYYINKTGRRITFEYSLIKGVNDGLNHAAELAKLLAGMLCHVNLININPVAERKYIRPGHGTALRFKHVLESAKIPATLRRELGRDIDAACGQLRRRYMKDLNDDSIVT